MPFQMNFTEPTTGTPHVESFWSIAELATRFLQASTDHGVIVVKYLGWHDKATYDNGKNAFAEKTYYLPPGVVHFERLVGDAYDLLEVAIQSVPEPGPSASFFSTATYIPRTSL